MILADSSGSIKHIKMLCVAFIVKSDKPKTEIFTTIKGRVATTCQRCQGGNAVDMLCNSCFIDIFNRRVVKSLRTHRSHGKNETWFGNKFTIDIIKPIIERPIELVTRPVSGSIRILGVTADDLACDLIKGYLEKPCKVSYRGLMPFKDITDRELARYASLRGYAYQVDNTGIKEFIHEVDARHPGTIHAIVESGKALVKPAKQR
jgi:hypothetical protein